MAKVQRRSDWIGSFTSLFDVSVYVDVYEKSLLMFMTFLAICCKSVLIFVFKFYCKLFHFHFSSRLEKILLLLDFRNSGQSSSKNILETLSIFQVGQEVQPVGGANISDCDTLGIFCRTTPT